MAKQVPLNRTNRQSRKEPKLLDQIKDKLRLLRYAYRTEQSYLDWVERFLRFSHDADGRWRHPRDLGKAEIERFLSDVGDQSERLGFDPEAGPLRDSVLV